MVSARAFTPSREPGSIRMLRVARIRQGVLKSAGKGPPKKGTRGVWTPLWASSSQAEFVTIQYFILS